MPQTDVIPTSASIASTGLNLRYIGNWVYGYSGTFLANGDNNQTVFEFTSGSGAIVGEFECMGAVDATNKDLIANGKHTAYTLSFNDVAVSILKISTTDEDMPSKVFQKVIIPPFTEVKLIVLSSGGSSTEKTTATFTGRVYGAE